MIFDMDSLFGDVAFLFVLAFVVVFVNGFGVYIHENAHKTIFGYYDVNSTIHYGFLFDSGDTEPDSSDFYMLDEQTQNSLKLAESNVDAFGYPLSTVSVLLSIILVFLIRIAWSHQTN